MYRLGGDEFAILTEGAGVIAERGPAERLSEFFPELSDAGFGPVGASIGSAALTEADGNANDWIRLTDERLYANKRLRCGHRASAAS